MWKTFLTWLFLYGCCAAVPYGGGKRNMPIIQREEEPIAAAATENAFQKPENANSHGHSTAAVELEMATAPETHSSLPIHSTLTLPSNATSIRADITDGFSCANKSYGYYADVENDCQIFHVCLPVTYADGKEHMFRWSFICPEETIFSQDSFTCMRREDMSIECEDSFQYYELNRNFGMIEEDKENHRHQTHGNVESNISDRQTIPAKNKNEADFDQSTAMTQHSMDERTPETAPALPTQLPAIPNEDEKVMMAMKPTAASGVVATKPLKPKPAKSPKPNRRKPAATTATATTSPSSTSFLVSSKKKPQRKLPTTTTTTPLNDATTFAAAAEIEVKPTSVINRFTKRPTLTNNFKEKLQQPTTSRPTTHAISATAATDTVPIRIELYNQKRKRPTFMNKKDSLPTPAAATTTTTKPTTTLAAESQPTTLAQQELILAATTMVTTIAEDVKENLPKDQELKPQASESNVIYVKPTLTALGESKKIEKPQPTEPEAVSNNLSGAHLAEMPAIKPLEAFEEIPAVITEVEEANESTNSKSTITADGESEALIHKSPAIFQQNSEENLSNNKDLEAVEAPSIEQMEQEKPADAPELITAPKDLEQQQSLVEEMFGETVGSSNLNDGDNKQATMGGFKPVDPAMAAEAEALIANFLNTLMKTDQVGGAAEVDAASVKPAIKEPQASNEVFAEKIDETKKSEPAMVETSSPTSDSSPASPAQQSMEASQSSLPSIMMMHSQPAEIFQIPVQVIQTPIEEFTPGSPAAPAAAKPHNNKPLSIDDVVDLVKVQLDQKPTTTTTTTAEVPAPPFAPAQPAAALPISSNDEIKYQKLGEESILPIYQRKTSNPAPSQQMLKAPNENPKEKENAQKNQNKQASLSVPPTPPAASTKKNETVKIETETKKSRKTQKRQAVKKSRSLKTNSSQMNPRKRQFLFRADAS